MSKYIKADDVDFEYEDLMYAESIDIIRCKECRYYLFIDSEGVFGCSRGLRDATESDFCSCGKKPTGGSDDDMY